MQPARQQSSLRRCCFWGQPSKLAAASQKPVRHAPTQENRRNSFKIRRMMCPRERSLNALISRQDRVGELSDLRRRPIVLLCAKRATSVIALATEASQKLLNL